jgi:CRISPR-associated exonuclease Cas4
VVALGAVGFAVLGALGAALILVGAYALVRRHREARYGTLVAVDDGPGSGLVLRSRRYRISGRPDEVRRRRDGRLVPVEFKSRSLPPRGPPRSHRVQVAAYCLLLEEAAGQAPPYGVIRYGDGPEVRLPWDDRARAELLAVRDELEQPYDGRATPSVDRCARCGWRAACDVRAV